MKRNLKPAGAALVAAYDFAKAFPKARRRCTMSEAIEALITDLLLVAKSQRLDEEAILHNALNAFGGRRAFVSVVCNNAAFEDGAEYELARILMNAGNDLNAHGMKDQYLRDKNGNPVGYLWILRGGA